MKNISTSEAIAIAIAKQDRHPKGWRMYPNGTFNAAGYVLACLNWRADDEDDYAFHFVMVDAPGGSVKLFPTESGGLVAKGSSGHPDGQRPHLRLFHVKPDFDDFKTFAESVASIQKAQKTGRKISILGKAFFESSTENADEFDQYLFRPEDGFDLGCKCPHIEITRAYLSPSRVEKLLSWF